MARRYQLVFAFGRDCVPGKFSYNSPAGAHGRPHERHPPGRHQRHAKGPRGFLGTCEKGALCLNFQAQQIRPWVVLLYEISPGTDILDYELCTEPLGTFPATALVYKMIEKQIKTSRKGAPLRRPASIIFTSDKLYKELGATIFKHGIDTKLWTEEENQGFGDDFIIQFSKKLRDKNQLGYQSPNLKPGLLSVVSKERAESFYEAAADFYKAKPWTHFAAKHIFSVSCPDLGGVRLCFLAVSTKDNTGITLGLETDPENLLHLLQNGERKDLAGPGAYHRCVLYTSEWGMPFDDLFDIERNHMALGGPVTPISEVFPFPFVFTTDMDAGLSRPPREEVEWMEICLRALTSFSKAWEAGKVSSTIGARNLEYDVVTWPHKLFKTNVSYYALDVAELVKDWPELVKRGAPVAKAAAPALPPFVEGENCIVCRTYENIVESVILKRCGGCKKKMYCSRECQAKHWATHKTECKP